MGAPVVIRIRDVKGRPPSIEVIGAPLGHNVYVGPLVNDPQVEQGALINLFGVDPSGSLPEVGWRFIDPALPANATRNALHILWLTHDRSGPFCSGDLQIGYNAVLPGNHYANPSHTQDEDLGPPASDWATVFSNETLTLLFRAESTPERRRKNERHRKVARRQRKAG
jgi:hypothetical protein